MDTFTKRLREYVRCNFQRYLLFKLISMSLRIIGLILIWSTVVYYLTFGLAGLILLGAATALYIFLEVSDLSYQKANLENVLSDGGSKWLN